MLIRKGKIDKFAYSTIKFFCLWQGNNKEDMPISETSLQPVKSTKDQYSDYIKKCYKSVRKRQHNRKMSNRSDTSSQRKKIWMMNSFLSSFLICLLFCLLTLLHCVELPVLCWIGVVKEGILCLLLILWGKDLVFYC